MSRHNSLEARSQPRGRRHEHTPHRRLSTATIPGRRPSSPVAATISSRTVPQPARASPPSNSRWCRKYGRSIIGITNTHCPITSSNNESKRRYRGVARGFRGRYRPPGSADRTTLRAFRSVDRPQSMPSFYSKGKGVPGPAHSIALATQRDSANAPAFMTEQRVVFSSRLYKQRVVFVGLSHGANE